MAAAAGMLPCSQSDFRIAIVCALKHESTAVIAMFDERWDSSTLDRLPNDLNEYSTGRIGAHNVVLAYLSGMGTSAAAASINNLRNTFDSIELALMVGICGGAPSTDDDEIILGDVIVSDSIVQYDFGSKYPHQLKRKTAIGDTLARPGPRIRAFLHKMQTVQAKIELQLRMQRHLDQMLAQQDFSRWKRPRPATDRLFDPQYRHKHQDRGICEICDACNEACDETCEEVLRAPCIDLGCSYERSTLRERVQRSIQQNVALHPKLHFGTVASANQVMKSATDRDEISKRENAIAFEMEGAGLWDYVPTLVVKGVCDYADSHKNKLWQKYACATAASYMKALLHEWTIAGQNKRHHAVESASSRQQNRVRTRKIIDSLWFREIEDRFDGVERAQFESFQWIFHEEKNPLISSGSHHGPLYASGKGCSSLVTYTRQFRMSKYPEWDPCSLRVWLREGRGIFWITGKPGCGKSTLMKFIYEDDEYNRLLRQWAEDCTLLTPAFFFWRAGSEMQKNQLGLLQSVLYQILKSNPELISKILEPAEQEDMLHMDETDQGSVKRSWTLSRVQSIFGRLLRIENVKICILIDGLDELQTKHLDMAEYLMELTQHDKVKVLVSGRSISEFVGSFHGCPTVLLHEWTWHDAEAYVRGRLLGKQFIREQAEFSEQDFETLIMDVLYRAEGVFIWIKTGVSALIDGIYKADTLSELQSRLAKLPREINDLYETILHSLDTCYEGESESFLSLILAAIKNNERTSTIVSLASRYDMNPDWVLRQAMDQGSFEKLKASTKRRLESRCSQFISFSYRRNGDWMIDFMHKTVFDFLESPKMQARLSASNTNPEFYSIAIRMANFAIPFAFRGVPKPHDFVRNFLRSGSILAKANILGTDSLIMIIRQLEEAVFTWFGDDSAFPANADTPVTEFFYNLYSSRYACDYLGAIYLFNAWGKYRKTKRTVALMCLMLYGDWAEIVRKYLRTGYCELTTGERLDMLTLAAFSPEKESAVSNLIEDSFLQDSSCVELLWKRATLMLSCQVEVSPVRYRLDHEQFFPPNFADAIKTLLQLGTDPNVVAWCPPAATAHTSAPPVPRSFLRVIRRCEDCAKTMITCFYTPDGNSQDVSLAGDGYHDQHIKEIRGVIQTLLDYKAQDAEWSRPKSSPQPEEYKLMEKLKKCKENESRWESNNDMYGIECHDAKTLEEYKAARQNGKDEENDSSLQRRLREYPPRLPLKRNERFNPNGWEMIAKSSRTGEVEAESINPLLLRTHIERSPSMYQIALSKLGYFFGFYEK